MAWIDPIELNMSISRRLYERHPSNALLATVQKIIIYSIFPLSIIVFFEAVVKNMILINLANLAISILNITHEQLGSKAQVHP